MYCNLVTTNDGRSTFSEAISFLFALENLLGIPNPSLIRVTLINIKDKEWKCFAPPHKDRERCLHETVI